MKRVLAVLSAALLMSVFTLAQRDQSTSSSSQSLTTSAAQSANQNSASATQEQSNPAGGSPNSAVPGRVTGEEPTRVQEALNKQLPAGDQVTASVADDGSLKLTGTVRSDADKAKAEEITRRVVNRNINNQIQVKPEGSSDQPK
ncbi:MAG: BON domain-containing protein [Acidobacteria bacterium]|nr:BON domain-containing protein [Acidobacteriota bacterium]